jgi:hypothetical protein
MVRSAQVLALVLLFPAIAWADGFMTAKPTGPVTVQTQSKQMVASPRQEALLIFDGSTVRVVLRTYFRAGPKELAWIIPVPQAPTEVQAADKNVFGRLEQQTAPRFYWVERRAKSTDTFGGALGGGGTEGGGEDVLERGVFVEAAGTAGIFEWTVLGATDADKLLAWLTNNQYAVPDGARPVVDLYVQGGWHWLAVKVRPDVANQKTLAPHPITYTYRDDKLVYPLVISQLSADRRNEIVLYVLARKRFVVENWPNTVISAGLLKREPSSPSGTNYERLVALQTVKNRGHLFIAEYSFDLKAGGRRELLDFLVSAGVAQADSPLTYLTRLRAIMTPESMDRDVILRQLNTAQPVANVFRLRD